MTTPILLPQFELTMESASIARWRVKEGDSVAVGQNLVEIETQKAVSEVNAPVAGVVRRICFADGATVPANATLCLLTTHPDEIIEADEAPSPDQRSSAGSPASGGEGNVARMDGVRASPAARKAARDLGVELSLVRGTGPGGRITPEDVAAFAKSGSAGPE